MGCNCGKPKCDGHCGVSPAVLQINNPSECVLFHRVEVPASMGDSTTNPPKPGAYRNTLLYYKADGEAFLYSSDGIPTKITGVANDYACLENKPQINGVTLEGNKSLDDIGVTDAIDNALEDYTPTSELAEVAFTGDYNDLENTPPKTFARFYMWPPSEGNAAPMYHDYGRTDQVTLAQFTDAIASGPVQIYMEHDGHTFWIYYVDQLDAFIPDPPMVIGTLDVSFGLRSQNQDELGVRRFYWQEGDTAPIYDSYNPNQSDWNETSPTRSSYIKNKPNLATVATSGSYNDLSNKPTIPAAQVNSDWNASSGVAQILNKPTLASVATSGNYDDLSNKPTIPAAQVNSDWNAASGVAQILNKPSLATVATSGSYNDLTDKPADFELVEMSYGESNAWAKFIAAYQSNKIVYCRVSSQSDPSTGTQGRKAFMAYVNNAENPTEVEFQYVRSVSSKTASQPVDQVYVYKLTNASGGTWTVESRNMAPKLAAGTNATVSYSNGTYTVGATVPTKTSDLTNDGATGTSVYVEESDIAPSELSGEGEFVTLEGTTDCSALDTQLLGNAEQTTYSGKNLLPPTATFSHNVNGLTFNGSGGIYNVSGNASAGQELAVQSTIANYTVQSGDYLHLNNDFTDTHIQFALYFSDGTIFNRSPSVLDRIESLSTMVGKTVAGIKFYFNSGYSFSGNFKPMILHNVSTTSDYEPYVGGIPAPNPSYPQPISTVTGAQTVTVTGKNLFNFQEFAQDKIQAGGVIRGVATATGDSITITATENDAYTRVDFAHGYPPTIRVKNNTDYVLSWKTDNTSGTNMGVVYVFARGSNNQNIIVGYRQDTAGSFQFNTGAYSEITFRFGVATSGNSITYSNIMLEYGSQPSGYKPYDGTQSYEVNLGKNLFDKNGANGKYQATLSITSESIKATATNNNTGYVAIAIPNSNNLLGKSCTISYNAQASVGVARTALYCASSSALASVLGSYIIRKDGNGDQTISFTFPSAYETGADCFVLLLYIQSTSSITAGDYATYSNIQLEAGSQPTAYSPYFAPIELAKVGTYQDRIYKNDGKWYIEKQVGKVVLDGTENWTAGTGGTLRLFYSAQYSDILSSNQRQDFLSNNFHFIASGNETGAGFIYQQRIYLYWGTIDNTASDFKTWLGAHNTTVYYALATPTTTEITDETLISQLEGLASILGYDGVTNIMSASPELPAILSVSTYTDSAIPPATRVRAGIVRIGDGIDVDDCGTISVNAQKAPTVITIDLGDQNDWGVVSNSLGPMLALGAGGVGSSQYDNRVRVVSLTPPTSTTFHNENTGMDMTLEEVFGLIESGEDVVFNNVPVGTYYDSRSQVYYPLGYAVNGVRVGDKINYSDGASFTGHVAINVPSPQSLDTQWNYNYPIVASISIRKLVVINGDISTTSYYLDVDGIYDGIVAD